MSNFCPPGSGELPETWYLVTCCTAQGEVQGHKTMIYRQAITTEEEVFSLITLLSNRERTIFELRIERLTYMRKADLVSQGVKVLPTYPTPGGKQR